MTTTEQNLLDIARVSAVVSAERHGYLPNTFEEANGFVPHAWVLTALQRAYEVGKNEGAAKTTHNGTLGRHSFID